MDLVLMAKQKAKEIYGMSDIYKEIYRRINEESDFIHKYYDSYLTLYEIASWCKKKNKAMFIDGTIGNSLIAYLNDITDINPLKPHYYCDRCGYGNWDLSVEDGYDLPVKKCPNCGKLMNRDGHDLDFCVHKYAFEASLENGDVYENQRTDCLFTGEAHNIINIDRDMKDDIQDIMVSNGDFMYIDATYNHLCSEYSQMVELLGYSIDSHSISSILNHLDSIEDFIDESHIDEYKRLKNILKPTKFSDYAKVYGLTMGQNSYDNYSRYHLNQVAAYYDNWLEPDVELTEEMSQKINEHTKLRYKSEILTQLVFYAKLSWLKYTFPESYKLIDSPINFIKNAFYVGTRIYPNLGLRSGIIERINDENWIYERFYNLFYMVYQFTEYCNQHDIPYAHESMINASLVAYLNGMTEINPLKPHYYCKECDRFNFNDDYEIYLDMPDEYCEKCGNKFEKNGCNLNIDYYATLDSTYRLKIIVKIAMNHTNEILDYLCSRGYRVEIISDKEYRISTKEGEYEMTLISSGDLDKLAYIAHDQGIKFYEVPVFNLLESVKSISEILESINYEGVLRDVLSTHTYYDYVRFSGFKNRLLKDTYDVKEELKNNKPSNKDERIIRLIELGFYDEDAYRFVYNLDNCINYYNDIEKGRLNELGISNLLSKSQCVINMFIDLRLAWYQANISEIEMPETDYEINSIVEEFIKTKYGYCPEDLYELELDRVFRIIDKAKGNYKSIVNSCSYCVGDLKKEINKNHEILVSYGLEPYIVDEIAKENTIFNFDTLENMADFMYIVSCFRKSDVYPCDTWDYYDVLSGGSRVIKSIEFEDLLEVKENSSIMHLCVNMGNKSKDYLVKQYTSKLICKRFNSISVGSCYMDNDINIEKLFYV